jgi:serine/threonine-protein kinase
VEKIAGYQLEVNLGPNAWGTGYKARQLSLDRVVYVTVLPPAQVETSRHSLARVCAAITHPHLVSGIDFGEFEGGHYIVTEWVEGPTVADVVERGGPLAEERVIEIALALSQALEYASKQGLVHGNLNPKAIVLVAGGSPKLRGFGADRDDAQSEEDYRSPEQRAQQATDVRSDIYALGSVLYYLLSGVHPFADPPPAQVVDGVVVEAPQPLSEVTRRLGPDLVALVERMMAWRPEDRFSNASDLAEALEDLRQRRDERPSIRPARPTRPARPERQGQRRPRPARARRRRRR